jgi:hypothetical protein
VIEAQRWPPSALFESRPQPHQGCAGGLFHVGHGLRLHLQSGVDHPPVRTLPQRHRQDRLSPLLVPNVCPVTVAELLGEDAPDQLDSH